MSPIKTAEGQDTGLSIGGSGPVTVVKMPEIRDPTSAEARDLRELRRKRLGYLRQLRIIRRDHFQPGASVEQQQIGLRKIRAYTDPAAFPVIVETLIEEGEMAREGILEHFAKQKSNEGDAALAWEAVYHEREEIRTSALSYLKDRTEAAGATPTLVREVVKMGLREPNNEISTAAASTARALDLIDLIPMIAAAQVATGAGSVGPQGDLGYIFIGEQQTFVADLTPIVSDGAVAFDPQLAVVSEGVILRVLDAAVVSYRTAIHASLVEWTTERWGQSTAKLGYDVPAWHAWYSDELLPELAERRAALEIDVQPAD